VRRQPQRSCVACRATAEKSALTRLARDAEGAVRPDPQGRAGGRGAYLCDNPACWRRAAGQPALFARALRAPAEAVDREILEQEAAVREARAGAEQTRAPATAEGHSR
jgi:predicted RNA-binding protein YlxR (DUF448 family)